MRWTGATNYPDEPITVHGREEVTRLLVHAVSIGASDVIFQSGRPVLASVHGHLCALTQVWLQPTTLARISAELTTTDSIMSKLYSGHDFDRAITVLEQDRGDRHAEPIKHRFRINVTAGYYEGDVGVQIVCRHIPADPPTVAALGVEPEIVAESTPAQGAVIVAGETGSGKTTTIAALMRRILEEDTPIHGNILTYEAPIEFVFETVPSATCTIMQHEIGLHLPSFAAGVRNSLRRKPGLIMVGELRDMDTVLASVEAAQTGHPIYTTTHANDVAHILRRLTLKFPTDLQVQAFHDVLSSTHMLVSQLLVPKVGGGRVCLREWQILTDQVRREVARIGMAEAVETLRTIIGRGEDGRSMKVTVKNALDRGLIDVRTANRALDRYGYRDARLAA
ncbi:type IV pilus twitching motility protein PilT [Methylobacterium indicum]|uniref:Secretion system protein E n=1 Tax=Methylobacterium indicum TaxID=1775910 RepID=A0ABR5HEG7_9HYPH|nr:ATPase, T2SS/T4P/T4SS family [Methylobacterium indicum]KMO17844.1 secretion system protein E [Methylobacterium indicum]KMO24852.1 secretion system protein E [Methylobacterium indicum]